MVYYSEIEEVLKRAKNGEEFYLSQKEINNMEMLLIEKGVLEDIFNFAKYVRGANISKLENVIIRKGTMEDVINFAKNIEGANVRKLQSVIMKYGTADNIYEFARDVEGANVKKLQEALCDVKSHSIGCYYITDLYWGTVKTNKAYYVDSKYLIYFAKNVKGADISELQNYAINIAKTFMQNYEKINKDYNRAIKNAGPDSRFIASPKYALDGSSCTMFDFFKPLYDFSKEIQCEDMEKVTEVVLSSKDPKTILKFAVDIKGVDVKKLEDAILSLGKPSDLIEFAAKVKRGANIERLEDAVVANGKPSEIISFAHRVLGANIERLENEIVKLMDAELIFQFATNIKGANIHKLENAIILTGDFNRILKFAKEVEGCKILKGELSNNMLEIKMIENLNDIKTIFDFGNRMIKISNHLNDTKLALQVIKIDASRIGDFLKEFKFVDLDELQDEIIALGDIDILKNAIIFMPKTEKLEKVLEELATNENIDETENTDEAGVSV